MPHFILECSNGLFNEHDKASVMKTVFDTARRSGLFNADDIKVRIRSYSEFITGGADGEFGHVFAYIMEGRTTGQKQALSRSIVTELKTLFPDAPTLSMNVMEFEKATYHNRKTV